MIELGKMQRLRVAAKNQLGAQLSSKDYKDSDFVLLLKNNMPKKN